METLKQSFICSLTAFLNFALLLIWSSKILFRERSLMEEIVWIEIHTLLTFKWFYVDQRCFSSVRNNGKYFQLQEHVNIINCLYLQSCFWTYVHISDWILFAVWDYPSLITIKLKQLYVRLYESKSIFVWKRMYILMFLTAGAVFLFLLLKVFKNFEYFISWSYDQKTAWISKRSLKC